MDPFVGEIQSYAFAFAPHGWARCDGQILYVMQNTALFSLLGTYYGGDGKKTFALPNLAGRVAAGVGAAINGTIRAGQKVTALGQDAVTLTADNLVAHAHPLSVATGTFTQLGGNSPTQPSNSSAPSHPWEKATKQFNAYKTDGMASGTMADIAMAPAGANWAHENRMPFVAVNFCIATQGVYPSRP